MSLLALIVRKRADFHAANGVLLITRDVAPVAAPPSPGQPPQVPANLAEGPEILLALWDDGSVTALHGHVDLGTGIRTALAQWVAEELDVGFDRVHMVLGDTAAAPNQGPTIASATLQIHALPLRQAAAQARRWLREQGAPSVADALRDRHVELTLDTAVELKSPATYRVVGRSMPRVDIPAKVFGEASFVHDLRLPGLLHGRVVRPPYAGADHGDFIGNTLDHVDEGSIAQLPGIRALVVIGDFIGLVAEREEQAEAAMHALRVHWKPWPGLPAVDDLAQALSANPATRRELVDEGDVDAALREEGASALARTYVWPYQMHASIGPSCAVAEWRSDDAATRLRVWAGTQNPHVLRADLARLVGVADTAVDVVRMEAAGCYGRNGADDVAADAALLARAVNAPVRVQLTREQEHLWEPKGAAQLMRVNGGIAGDGAIAAWDFETSYPSNGAPTLALLLTRTIEPKAQAFEMGDRSARPPYAVANLRVAVNDMPPILRASWLRGVSALPNSFAHESYVDELASAARADPVAYRLRHLGDPRAAELIRATADKAGWRPHAQPRQQGANGDWLHGQGFAYARYTHSKWPGFGAAWSAWVADVDVNRTTGEVHVKRVVVGHDAGLMVNPAGVAQQVHGNVVQTTSRALKERVSTSPDTGAVTAAEWGGYPILSFRSVPVIEVVAMQRPGEPALGAGESASVPGTAAIANAIYDATGVRFRQPPFTPDVVRAALNPLPAPERLEPPPAQPLAPADAPWPRGRSAWAKAVALTAGVMGLGAALIGWRPAIAPIARPDASAYSAATIEQGRLLAAAGNCAHCHTTAGGAAYA
ncbi:MAG: xanthine dehydrogenase family protein molybdopterin-binding subunit, partial [Burkholderiales bacterium]|nr:xanthine dehydrogenase family protein molybdopterin-binding subunit [Burkholderiales bacterium]